MKYIFLLTIFFSSPVYAQDTHWCEQISPGQQGKPCDGKDPNGKGSDKDRKDDVICFSYGTDTEGQDSEVGAGESIFVMDPETGLMVKKEEEKKENNPLKDLGGCFQGLGDYFGGGQFAADLRNVPGGISKGWKDFLDSAKDRVWKPFEKSVNKLFGGGSSSSDKKKAMEKEMASLRDFIKRRESDKNMVDAEIHRTAQEWPDSEAAVLALAGGRDSGNGVYSDAIAGIRAEANLDEVESLDSEKSPDYPFDTPLYTSGGSKLYQAQAYYNYAQGKLAQYAGPDLPMKQQALEEADSYLTLADRFFLAGEGVFGERSVAIARQAIDLSLGMVPGVSFGLDAYQLIYGRNYLTGEEVTDTQKAIIVGALFAPAVISGSVEVVGKVAVKLANMAEKPAAQKLLKAIAKADEEIAPVLGKTPCVASNLRPMQRLIRGLHDFVFPTAYACPGVGSITDELVGRAQKIGRTSSEEIQDYARFKEWSSNNLKEAKWLPNNRRGFTPDENAAFHYSKHKAEFPEAKSTIEYVEQARSFVTTPPSGTLIASRTDGATLFYHEASNTYAVKAGDDSLGTMFKPDDLRKYWDDELKRSDVTPTGIIP